MEERTLIQSIFPVLVLATATIAGWIVKPIDFRLDRPPREEKTTAFLEGQQTIEAHLWEDPFIALAEHDSTPSQETAKSHYCCTGNIPAKPDPDTEILEKIRTDLALKQNDKPNLVLLGWTLDGEGSNETESRRRIRHATLSALGSCGYAPRNNNHLGLLTLSGANGAPDKIGIKGVFEWYEPANDRAPTPYGKILVLWLPENIFLESPLPRLDYLMGALGRKIADTFDLAILGPRTSTGLVELCENAAETTRHDAYLLLAGAHIYSATATVADELIPDSTNETPGGRPRLKENLHNKFNIEFHDFAANDRTQTLALVEELQKLRGISSLRPQDKILLVSEWDTDYGRALPLTFAANWDTQKSKEFGPRVRTIQAAPEDQLSPQLIKVSYAAGVDGEREPQQRKTPASSESAAEPKDSRVISASRYQPFGNSQFDYAERLAVQLEESFSPRSNNSQPERVVAVGVLGVDFYDKLILLQALRPKFPEALFFTTDLDARMLTPEIRPYTHNLLVASNRALETERQNQRLKIAPFRDGYQVAVYQAVSVALKKTASDEPPAVKTFEIGRTKAVELSSNTDTPRKPFKLLLIITLGILLVASAAMTWYDLPGENQANPKSLHAKLTDYAPLLLLACAAYPLYIFHALHYDYGNLWLCIAIITGGALLALRSHAVPDNTQYTPKGHLQAGTITLYIMCACMAFLLLASFFGENAPGVEPFYWFEGVSLWPTEIVRVAAGLLGIYFIIHSHRRLKTTIDRLTCDYKLKGNQRHRGSKNEKLGSKPSVNASIAWMDYCKRILIQSDKKSRFWWLREASWIIGTSVVLVLLWSYFTYIKFNPLHVPFRGDFSQKIDQIVVLFVMIVYTVLLVYVFDIIRKTRELIRWLAEKPTDWPEELLNEKEGSLNIDGRHIDGWLDVSFVGELTETVGRLVILPFILLFILLAATNSFFDNWVMNRPDVIVLSVINAAIPLFCGALLCREAQKMRMIAEGRLRTKIIRETDEENGQAEKYNELLTEIRACKTGAFRPIYEQPYIIALLIPLGGSGGIEVIQRLISN